MLRVDLQCESITKHEKGSQGTGQATELLCHGENMRLRGVKLAIKLNPIF